MTERVNFSANAKVYDRRHGPMLSADELDRLWLASRLQLGVELLDIGAGTGRVAIPFAARGCDVVALEPAVAMVKELRIKAGATKLSVVVGEGAQLPFSADRFDAVVIARLLYLTADWREILREARRVLAAGGCLLHEWGNGESDEPWVQIREQARTLFEQAGVSLPFHPGVRSEAEVHEHLEVHGFVHDTDLSMGPGPSLALGEFLRRLVDGELSYIWSVPEAVRAECLPPLKRWSEQTFDLESPVCMPRELRWSLYRKDRLR
ncbi:MAG TPA: class I SAM-dependent methyltransferase [Vicinamibacterales bacterium]|nr:class I SAM-dependent methyltransferase [Vicinamibacterales bacterium]